MKEEDFLFIRIYKRGSGRNKYRCKVCGTLKTYNIQECYICWELKEEL